MKLFNSIIAATFFGASLITATASQASIVFDLDTNKRMYYNDGDSSMYVESNGSKTATYGFMEEDAELIEKAINSKTGGSIAMPIPGQPSGLVREIEITENGKLRLSNFLKSHKEGKVCAKGQWWYIYTGKYEKLSGCYTHAENASVKMQVASFEQQRHVADDARRRSIVSSIQRNIQMNRPRTCFGSANTFGRTTYGSATCY